MIGCYSVDIAQFLVLLFLSLSYSILGPFLVIRKITMVANSISHSVLVGIIVVYLCFGFTDTIFGLDLHLILLSAFCSSIVTIFLTDFVNRFFHLQKDASTGLVFTFLFAVGILLVTLFTKDTHLGTEIVLGNLEMVHISDIKAAFFVFLLNLIFFVCSYRALVTLSFDVDFARITNIPVHIYSYLLFFQTSITLICGIRGVGVILVLALLVVPVITARAYTNSFKNIIVLSGLLSIFASLFSVILSRYMFNIHGIALSTSGLLVVVELLLWILLQWYKMVPHRDI